MKHQSTTKHHKALESTIRHPVPFSRMLLDAASQAVNNRHQDSQAYGHHYAQGRQLDVRAVLPHLPYLDGEHLAAGGPEKYGAAELTDREKGNVDAPGQETGPQQREKDPYEGLEPGGAAGQGGLL